MARTGYPVDVLYAVTALRTAIGVYMREDAIGRTMQPDGSAKAYIRSTLWKRLVSEREYLDEWVPRLELVGDPYQPSSDEWENTIETWIVSHSQLSDNEGYTGDKD